MGLGPREIVDDVERWPLHVGYEIDRSRIVASDNGVHKRAAGWGHWFWFRHG